MTDSIYPDKYVKQQYDWRNLVPVAYEQTLADTLAQSAEFRRLYAKAREEERQAYAIWWAEQTLWTKIRYRIRQAAKYSRHRLYGWQDSARWWLSNLIYKHEECDW